MHLEQEGKKLLIKDGIARVVIEPWGKNSLRVRMTKEAKMDENDWALTEPVEETESTITFEEKDVTDPWYQGEEWKKYHQTVNDIPILTQLLHGGFFLNRIIM